jgi:predicted enzyme related to lactoylglutathione lyase
VRASAPRIASLRGTYASDQGEWQDLLHRVSATDIQRSSEFYKKVFGWNLRTRGDGAIAFDDSVGEVSGTWVVGRPPSPQPGLLFYIMVDSVAETVKTIIASGGDIVQPVGADAPEITARFRDPGGNVIGLYQQPA